MSRKHFISHLFTHKQIQHEEVAFFNTRLCPIVAPFSYLLDNNNTTLFIEILDTLKVTD